jgi:C_GCAxxG_C_C family probable redox protein
MKIAALFGGGIGRQGHVCGAATGALMALGLKFGHTDPELIADAYHAAENFLHRFKATHGAVNCRDLLGVDIGDPTAVQTAREQDIFSKTCPALVRSAAAITVELIEKEEIA